LAGETAEDQNIPSHDKKKTIVAFGLHGECKQKWEKYE
jgi:hypothetical protein